MSKVLKNVANSSLLIDIFYIVDLFWITSTGLYYLCSEQLSLFQSRKVCLKKRLFFTLALSQVSWYVTVKLTWKWPNSIQYEDLHKTFVHTTINLILWFITKSVAHNQIWIYTAQKKPWAKPISWMYAILVCLIFYILYILIDIDYYW